MIRSSADSSASKKSDLDILDRVPPQDLAAERSVLGSILLEPAILDEITLRPSQCYAAAHELLLGRLHAMRDAGPVDLALLVSNLRKSGDLERIGGEAYLGELLHSVATHHHARYYAAIVTERAERRRLIQIATSLLRDAFDDGHTIDDVLNQAEAALAEVGKAEQSAEPKPIAQAVASVLAAIDAAKHRAESIGLPTGLHEFDNSIGGLFPGELFILAARPGVGKTSLACQIADHNAQRGRLVYFASLEMSAEELSVRLMCSEADVSSRLVRTGALNDKQRQLLVDAGCRLAAATMVIHDHAAMTVQDIRRAARRHKRAGLALVVVDYLQRITPTDRRIQRHEQIGQISDGLKELARELEVPVMCLCQLSREAEKASRASMAHLRESGSIEQDADVVTILERRPENGDEHRTEWTVDKNRNGDTGRFILQWEPSRTRYCGAAGPPAADGYGSEWDPDRSF